MTTQHKANARPAQDEDQDKDQNEDKDEDQDGRENMAPGNMFSQRTTQENNLKIYRMH